MHFRDIYRKKEAQHLIFAVKSSDIEYYDNDTRIFFERIIDKIHKYDSIRNHHWDETDCVPDEAPFIQGDKIEQGLPDIIFEGEDFILGIEDFEFDASKKTKKGSKMRIAELRTKKQLEQKMTSVKEPIRKPTIIESFVDVDFSYKSYVQSLLNAFQTHSNNIENYRNSMQRIYPNKHIFLAFYIEDITAIGNYIDTQEGTKPMCPLFVKEFLDILSNISGLDYILARVQNTYTYKIHIQKVDPSALYALYENSYDLTRDKFISYHYKKSQRIY